MTGFSFAVFSPEVFSQETPWWTPSQGVSNTFVSMCLGNSPIKPIVARIAAFQGSVFKKNNSISSFIYYTSIKDTQRVIILIK